MMMSFFKKIVNRLFGDEETPEHTERAVEGNEEDRPSQKEVRTDLPQRSNRTFEFPVMPDEIEEQVEKKLEEEQMDFEPQPLYLNKRWPGKKEAEVSDVPILPNLRREEKRVERPEPTEEPIIVDEKRPFRPTVVPSPIFGMKERDEEWIEQLNTGKKDRTWIESNEGLIRPKKHDERSNEEIAQQLNEVRQDQEVDDRIEEPAPPSVTGEPIEEAIETGPLETVESPDERDVPPSLIVEEPSEDAKKRQTVETYERPDEEDLFVADESSEQESEQHSTDDQERTLSVEEDILIKDDMGATDETTEEILFVEEDVLPNHYEPLLTEESNVEEQRRVKEEALCEKDEVEEEESFDEVDASEKHEATEQKENIRPFNVVMLASDKKKWEAQRERERAMEATRAVVEEGHSGILSDDDAVHLEEEQTEVDESPKFSWEDTGDETNRAEESNSPELEVVQPLEMESDRAYHLPSLHYLAPAAPKVEDTEWLNEQSLALEDTLRHFGIESEVKRAVQGPTVTRFELTVARGTKVNKIKNLTDDLKMALAARDIRIEAPIPGTHFIGVEIPNRTPRAVSLSEVLTSDVFNDSSSALTAAIGVDITGNAKVLDLRRMPHGLIAGATGSGKSVCINSILVSLLYKATPDELRLLLIDPKMVELAPYDGIPHLLSPVITDVKAATMALKWAVNEMEDRYERFAAFGVRNIDKYNELAQQHSEKNMPYLLVVIDELADLMMLAPQDVEISISRIAQKARAAGIHLLIATQRPSVDVITGTIKSNIPTRIAFSVASHIDSRTILDESGAEHLLGRGDLLLVENGKPAPVRLQGTYVSDEEIEQVVDHVRRECPTSYAFGQGELLAVAELEERDPLFREACEYIASEETASVSALQRRFNIGYNRAAKMVDEMEEMGFVSESRGSKGRDVYVTEEELFDRWNK